MSQAAMSVAAGAGTVAKRLEAFKATHGSVIDGNSTQYKELPSAMAGVRQAVETAIAIDEQKSTSFWQEVGQLFSHGFNYAADKQRFFDEINALKKQARQNVDLLEDTLKPAFEHLDVPEQIIPELEDWQAVNGVAQRVAETVPDYETIEGWQGGAAQDYGVMTRVQVEAVTEFAAFPDAMTLLLGNVLQLNEAVLGATHGYVSGAQADASVCVPSGPNEFFANTANADNVVRQCIADVASALTMADLAVDKTAQEITAMVSSPVVIADVWPTGSEMAGVSAAQVHYHAESDITAPPPTAPVREGDPINR